MRKFLYYDIQIDIAHDFMSEIRFNLKDTVKDAWKNVLLDEEERKKIIGQWYCNFIMKYLSSFNELASPIEFKCLSTDIHRKVHIICKFDNTYDELQRIKDHMFTFQFVYDWKINYRLIEEEKYESLIQMVHDRFVLNHFEKNSPFPNYFKIPRTTRNDQNTTQC